MPYSANGTAINKGTRIIYLVRSSALYELAGANIGKQTIGAKGTPLGTHKRAVKIRLKLKLICAKIKMTFRQWI